MISNLKIFDGLDYTDTNISDYFQNSLAENSYSCRTTFLEHFSPNPIMLIDKEVFIHLFIHCLEIHRERCLVFVTMDFLYRQRKAFNGLTYLSTNLKERKVLRYISTTYFHYVILITKEAFCQRFVVLLSVHPQACVLLFMPESYESQ